MKTLLLVESQAEFLLLGTGYRYATFTSAPPVFRVPVFENLSLRKFDASEDFEIPKPQEKTYKKVAEIEKDFYLYVRDDS